MSLDLEKSFYQVAIPEHLCTLFAFAIGSADRLQHFAMSRLPMGFGGAVDIMHRIMSILVLFCTRAAQQHGYDLFTDVYVDNALIIGPVEAISLFLQEWRAVTIKWVVTTGELLQGSFAEPVKHRGIMFALGSRTISLKLSFADTLAQRVTHASTSKISVAMKETLLGQVVYADTVVHATGAKHTHPILSWGREPDQAQTRLPRAIARDIIAWIHATVPLPIPWKLSTVSVSDASDWGWALWWISLDQQLPVCRLSGQWSDEWRNLPIYVREAVPVVLASLLTARSGHSHLQAVIDNASLLGAISNRYSPSLPLHTLVSKIWSATQVRTQYVESKKNFTDQPSRGEGWQGSLCPEWVIDGSSPPVDGWWRQTTHHQSSPTKRCPAKIYERHIDNANGSLVLSNATINQNHNAKVHDNIPRSPTQEKMTTKKIRDIVLVILRRMDELAKNIFSDIKHHGNENREWGNG
jgi:hypothetical protein